MKDLRILSGVTGAKNFQGSYTSTYSEVEAVF